MRLYLKELAAIQAFVSIHASVKDATRSFNTLFHRESVSIHASVKDATDFRFWTPGDVVVSIHASVKDATRVVVPRLE